MASSLQTFLPFPPFYLSLLVGLYLGSHVLLDSITYPSFSPGVLVARALWCMCPLNFPRS